MTAAQKPEAQAVAWLYDRIGSELNPHLMLAGQNADDLRIGRPGIMAPCANHPGHPHMTTDTKPAAKPEGVDRRSDFKCPVCASHYFGPLFERGDHVGRYCKGWPSGFDRSYTPCRGNHEERFISEETP